MPENLIMLGISTSSRDIAAWNMRSKTYFDGLFQFAHANLYDEGVLVVTHASSDVPVAIENWTYSTDFYVADEWFGISEFDLQSPSNPLAVVRFFFFIHLCFFVFSFLIYKLIIMFNFIIDMQVLHQGSHAFQPCFETSAFYP
jgi:hypothetical protein